jgi:hypothetical protein
MPCDFITDASSVVGEVRNLSAGGLGVLAEAPALEQGEPVRLVLRPPGARPIEISAIVWHARGLRRSASGKSARSFGLVLTDASTLYVELVEKLSAGDRRRQPATPTPQPAPSPPSAPRRDPVVEAPPEPEPKPEPALHAFSIRIRQVGGSRTCRVSACGATEPEAVEAALAEVGEGWVVLDARPQP